MKKAKTPRGDGLRNSSKAIKHDILESVKERNNLNNLVSIDESQEQRKKMIFSQSNSVRDVVTQAQPKRSTQILHTQ